MSINLNPGAPPIFLGSPLVTKASFSPPSGTNPPSSSDTLMGSLLYRMYQLDPLNIIVASTTASMGSPISASAPFIVGSLLINAFLDTILLLNTNLQHFIIQGSSNWASGSPTWTTILDYSSVALSQADLVSVLNSAVQYNAIKIVIYSTQDGNAPYFGFFNVALSTFQMSNPPTKLEPSYRQARRDVPCPDGSRDVTYFYWSDASFTLTDWNLEIDFANIYSAADKSNLDSIFTTAAPFLFMAEPGDAPRNIQLSLIDPKAYIPGYNSQWKSGGRKLPFKTEAVGFI